MKEAEIRALPNPGLPEEEWARWIEEQVVDHGKLDRCECPQCGGALTKKYDQRQDGPSSAKAGRAWFNYRCTVCKFFADRLDPE